MPCTMYNIRVWFLDAEEELISANWALVKPIDANLREW